jgi:hypothetical protein
VETTLCVLNHTLRVEIVLCEINLLRIKIKLVPVEITLRVEITLVSVIFTRIRVKLTLVCVESTLCVKNHTLRVEILLCV